MGIYDAVIVGSGPNGLAAAITLACKGYKILILEAASKPGGGLRSDELTFPGYIHDVCSAIHPLAKASEFFQSLPLEEFGLEWINPEIALAHPFDDGTAGFLYQSVENTANTLDKDREKYISLIQPMLKDMPDILTDILRPIRFPAHPWKMLEFGKKALLPSTKLIEHFRDIKARAFFSGMAAHSIMDLNSWSTSAYALLFPLLGHYSGWPFPKGGAQQLANAMLGYMNELGIEVITDFKVNTISDIPSARTIIFDVTPRQLLNIAGDRLPSLYRKQLESFRYGPGVFKIDWALKEAIPFKNEQCRNTVTFHIGGTAEEIIHSEKETAQGRHPKNPFVILVQHTVADPSRAPKGRHTGWAYCHVPNGSTLDCTEKIERQIERFAPGFRDIILKRHVMNTHDYECYNANYVGGDINGGIQDIRQLLTRPAIRWNPYRTGARGIYLCSSSTPPGGGVHGMCGFNAAQSILKNMGGNLGQ